MFLVAEHRKGLQAMIPFDDEELEYIARLDAQADADLLRRELPSLRDSCLRTMEVSTTLLQVRVCGSHVNIQPKQ